MGSVGPRAVILVVAAVVERDGKYLITQRRASAVLPNLWEFPGGRVEVGETDEDALAREVFHRVGAKVQVGRRISAVTHDYEHYSVELHLYACDLDPHAEATASHVQNVAWVTSAEFERYPFTPADEASMTALLGL